MATATSNFNPVHVPVTENEVTRSVLDYETGGPDAVLVSETEALTLNEQQPSAHDYEYEQDQQDNPTKTGLASHDQAGNHKLELGTALATDPVDLSRDVEPSTADVNGEDLAAQHPYSTAVDHPEAPTTDHTAVNGEAAAEERPGISREPSRSYINKPIPIVTTYEHEAPETRVRSTAPSVRAPSVNRAQSVKDSNTVDRAPSRLETTRPPTRSESRADTRPASRAGTRPASRAEARPASRAEARPASRAEPRPASRADTTRAPTVTDAGVVYAAPLPASRAASVKAGSVRSPSIKEGSIREKSGRPGSIREKSGRPGSVRASSRAGSIRDSVDRGHSYNNGPSAAVGDVVSFERQRQLQQGGQDHNTYGRPLFDQSSNQSHQRSMSPRPASAFGHRPQPNLVAVVEDGRESRYDGSDSRAGMLNRSGTVLSRANTLGRNGTLSRAANGGTVGSRRGAFGRGAGASIGTQPEEVLGRDDIHTRAELSERILDEATLRRLSTMEKKDAVRLAKLIKDEAKAEAKSVKASIKELERLSRLQKDAASAERKSQLRLGKWTKREHKARLRFLKEKERYEKVEGELRNAENDYEERRDHAAGLTAQVAEKTQELDDLRGQKAADDREREVKLLALKNPAHS